MVDEQVGPWVIRLMGMADGVPCAYDGQWVVEYDPCRMGTSPEPECLPTLAHLVTTDDKTQALRFDDPADIYACMMTPTGRPRSDGGIDRPLLAFHLMIDPADDHE